MGNIMLGRRLDPVWEGETLQEMFRFRHKVFCEKLRWEVDSHNGMEMDHYDDLNPVYMISKDDEDHVDGCWRFLPTTGPYMLKDTFPQLLQGTPAPQSDEVWELSRFAVACNGRNDLAQAGVGEVTFEMIRSALEFAQKEGIDSYVTVTSAALERLLKRAGVSLRRLGDGRAQRIGKVLTVACTVDVQETLRRVIHWESPQKKRLQEAA